MLGKKQTVKNEDWLKAAEHIEERISREETELLAAITIEEIRKNTQGKKAAYAWSGGKDSIVLGHLCEKAGIRDCVLGRCDLEYPAFLSWIESNQPKGLEIVNTGQGIDWLAKHEKFLFPQNSMISSRWFSMVQHTAQRQYVKAHNIDVLLLGRRKADGNYTGNGNCYTDGEGVTRYSPLADWKHEAILGYIHYYNLPLPPIYGWKNGYLCGTHPWPARQWTGSIESGWKEIYDIDCSIVIKAAESIQSAKEFLKEVKG